MLEVVRCVGYFRIVFKPQINKYTKVFFCLSVKFSLNKFSFLLLQKHFVDLMESFLK